ncbi:MAG: hypothetical protein NTW11_00315 [Candidatus Staskawiczbacteria bacterium]|nr:hypothetical protein [Candidatus Staskawiczbacteria bacterium]
MNGTNVWPTLVGEAQGLVSEGLSGEILLHIPRDEMEIGDRLIGMLPSRMFKIFLLINHKGLTADEEVGNRFRNSLVNHFPDFTRELKSRHYSFHVRRMGLAVVRAKGATVRLEEETLGF